MAEPQAAFLQQFKSLFAARFKEDVAWRGGQSKTNLAGFLRLGSDHRPAGPRKGEGFELGDAIGDFRGWTIIVEFESFPVWRDVGGIRIARVQCQGAAATKKASPLD